MRRVLVLTCLLLAACGSAPLGKTAASPTAAAIRSPTTSTSFEGITAVTFACKLPIAQIDSSGKHQGAFVTFPSGDFTIDPNGAFQSFGDQLIQSVAQPYLYGSRFDRTTTFTRRYGRWLPASVATVSPDSSHYAYWEFTFANNSSSSSRVHLVQVTSGVDRIVYSQGFYMVIADESEGIYLAQTSAMGEGYHGLWLLDPTSGSLRAVSPSNQMFYLIGASAAWTGDMAPGDQAPGGMFPMDRVLRLDLKSRVSTAWFRRPGLQVAAIGFDSQGHLIVSARSTLDGATSTSEELWLVTAPEVARRIYSGPGSDSPDFVGFSTPLADSHGVWFGSKKGLYLYTPDGTLQKVSTAVGDVAGRCS
jgi:hypothetical protein